MKYTITIFNAMRVGGFGATHRTYYRRYYTESEKDKKEIHPYRRIHPWKSETEFANSLLKNVIYNTDGIVAINKPYGISVNLNKNNSKNIDPLNNCHKIVKVADYNIEHVLPYLAKELDVPTLIPCTGSEKFMTGTYIFGTSKKVCEDINLAQKRAIHMKQFKKYWAITIRVPNVLKGQYHLGMYLRVSPEGNKKPIIMTTWSNNAEKRKDIKILNINYKLISNSTHNLSSLIELDASTKKWHCIRLFAATMLYSPLLGDNYHGSRVQKLMGTWVKVNPFANSCNDMPVINQDLLKLLNISRNQQEIIPCHNHLRSIFLRSYGKTKTDILIEAPLIDPFNWTCKQLMLKNIPYEVDSANAIVENKVETCDANMHAINV